MSRIETLHIHNLKFFDEQKPIKLGGKHLLLFGENGSGKSSVYWILYTLFKCSLKDKADFQKYFKQPALENPVSLVNIYMLPIEKVKVPKQKSKATLCQHLKKWSTLIRLRHVISNKPIPKNATIKIIQ